MHTGHFINKVIIAAVFLAAATSHTSVAQNVMDFMPSDVFFPFQPTHASPGNITDVSAWSGNDRRPAGSDGFISVEGDHFVDGKGREIRFIGTNIGMTGCFPEHEDAEQLALELKRYGINIVRLHYVSHRSPKEGYPVKDSFIEPLQLERFDYLFAKLKEQGIYTYFQLNIARKFGRVNGVENAHLLPYYKNGIDNVDPLMISLQKRFHKEILTHVNPYTGLSYKDDPAVAMMELANENSIVNAWYAPKYNFPNIVEPYRTRMRERWETWLRNRYGNIEGMDLEPTSRKCDYAEFLYGLESSYFSDLYFNVKHRLGVRCPVTGTQLGYGFNQPQAATDFCDMHGYWCHPAFPGGKWNNAHWNLRNGALVNSFGHPASVLAAMAHSRILGKPFTVSEYDHPNLNFYCAEGNLMLSAMGAFQNWSALMQFAWILDRDYDRDYICPMFDMCSATQKLAHFPACWAMFVRGDVKKGSAGLVFAFPSSAAADIQDVARNGAANAHNRLDSELLKSLPLSVLSGRQIEEQPGLFSEKGRKIIREESDVPEPLSRAYSEKLLKSGTGEILWDWREPDGGVFMVDTERTKVFSGFVRGRSFLFRGMKLTPGKTRSDWLTLSLTLSNPRETSFRGNILQPGSWLLAVTGLVGNTDEKIVGVEGSPGKISCSAPDGGRVGTGPVLCEGVEAELVFAGLGGRLRCYALDPGGQRKFELPVGIGDSGEAVVRTGPQYRTVWYEIAVSPLNPD